MAISNTGVWLLEKGGQFAVKEAPLPTPGPGEVLIKNGAVVINPMDWKIQAYGAHLPFPKTYPFVGADVAGEIYSVGPDITTFSKGDRVTGVANWIPTDDIRDSGFQNYTICKTTLVSPLPDTLSFESGSALPLALSTASMGLYPSGRLELPLPQVTKPKPINKTILVWGGSSSTGSATIQLAVASGVNVVATASVKNHAFLRNLGVAKVLDYREESVVQDLVEAILETPGEFAGVLDAIGEEGTVRACMDVVSSLGGGRVVTNVPTPFEDTPNGVEVVGVVDTAWLPDNKRVVDGIWGKFIAEALRNGTLKAVPEPLVIGSGLEKIPEGVFLSQQGVSVKTIVVSL